MTAGPERNPSADQFSHVLVALSNFEDRSAIEKNEVIGKAKDLADHLIDSFFLPCKLSSAIYILIF